MTENFNDNNTEEILETSETNEVSNDLQEIDTSFAEIRTDVQVEPSRQNENLNGMISVRPVKTPLPCASRSPLFTPSF